MYIRRTPPKAVKGKIGRLYFYVAAIRIGAGWELSGRLKYK